MDDIIKNLPKLAKDKHKESKSFFGRLKKKAPKQLDYIMQALHEEEFERTDCLKCANCCKTTGPLFSDKDIDRISKQIKIKPQQFIELALHDLVTTRLTTPEGYVIPIESIFTVVNTSAEYEGFAEYGYGTYKIQVTYGNNTSEGIFEYQSSVQPAT